jgi:REP element-mobilizing transposase RayT
LFGEVVGGEMRVNAIGKIVQEEWFRSARIRKEIHLIEDEFVVMPNHIHGIVWIDTPTVGADGVRPEIYTATHHAGASLAPLHRKPRALGSFIAGFKASVTRRVGGKLDSGNIWQRNYYEHIIRDNVDYKRIAGYILDNPLNWDQDEENPKNQQIHLGLPRGSPLQSRRSTRG